MKEGEMYNLDAHYRAVASSYYKRYMESDIITADTYPAAIYLLQILVKRAALTGTRSIYDVGVGEGTPLVTFARMGYEVHGCDIVEEMVERSRAKLEDAGFSGTGIHLADIQDSSSLAEAIRSGPYDVLVAAGVMPHVRSDASALENMRLLLRPGGTALVEFRNKLFSLFTFNRFTKQFIMDDLLQGVADDVREAVSDDLDKRVERDLPPTREPSGEGSPAFAAMLYNFHNPFLMADLFTRAGFTDVRLHWYHYHAAPPMLEHTLGPRFREESFRLEEKQSSWRGYFLCSAYVVEATAV